MQKIDPKIVRAWFDTALNPLINALENEKIYLQKGELSWRSFTSNFINFKPIKYLIDYRYWPNVEQLLAFNPNISEILKKHDDSLTDLKYRCEQIENSLLYSDNFKSLYSEVVNHYFVIKPELTDHQKNYFKDEGNLIFIIDYLINKVTILENEYLLSNIWNDFQKKFYETLNDNEINILFIEKEKSVQTFLEILVVSINTLKETRNEISLTYGEPIVMLAV